MVWLTSYSFYLVHFIVLVGERTLLSIGGGGGVVCFLLFFCFFKINIGLYSDI